MSPSSRGRGLKYRVYLASQPEQTSPSSRGRGLKFNLHIGDVDFKMVALFTRAWIEIFGKSNSGTGVKSPSSRGRGLK